MKSRYLFIITIIILLSTNCSKTLFLNQKAEILSYKRKESTFIGSFDLGPGFINTSFGFQQRFGISRNDKVEYYFSILNNVTFWFFYSPYICYGDIKFDNGFKFLLYHYNYADLSLILHWGSAVGGPPIIVEGYVSYMQSLGVKLVGNYQGFYYGFPVKLNLFIPQLSLEIEGGFVVGGEYENYNFVIRNEFGASIIYTTPAWLSLYLGYGISVGRRYY